MPKRCRPAQHACPRDALSGGPFRAGFSGRLCTDKTHLGRSHGFPFRRSELFLGGEGRPRRERFPCIVGRRHGAADSPHPCPSIGTGAVLSQFSCLLRGTEVRETGRRADVGQLMCAVQRLSTCSGSRLAQRGGTRWSGSCGGPRSTCKPYDEWFSADKVQTRGHGPQVDA